MLMNTADTKSCLSRLEITCVSAHSLSYQIPTNLKIVVS